MPGSMRVSDVGGERHSEKNLSPTTRPFLITTTRRRGGNYASDTLIVSFIIWKVVKVVGIFDTNPRDNGGRRS